LLIRLSVINKNINCFGTLRKWWGNWSRSWSWHRWCCWAWSIRRRGSSRNFWCNPSPRSSSRWCCSHGRW